MLLGLPVNGIGNSVALRIWHFDEARILHSGVTRNFSFHVLSVPITKLKIPTYIRNKNQQNAHFLH
jgi:hypothetical protein